MGEMTYQAMIERGGPEEDEVCYDPDRTDVPGDGIVRRNNGHMAYGVELEYILFLSIDLSLCRSKTIFFRGCAKFRPLAFLKIQYGRRHTQISLNWQ